MPEGDTIRHAAHRMRPILEGRVPDAIMSPHPRFAADRWPQRLAGRAIEEIQTHGKHLFLRFDGDLTVHSHLRMTGLWSVRRTGRPWVRGRYRAWLVITSAGHDVVQFDGPVLELLTETRLRFDQRLAALGPDVLADEFDGARFLRRLREDDPTRTIGEALMDQRTVAGIGNIWKAEGCWEAAIDPWRRAGAVSDDEVLAVIAAARPRMLRSATEGHKAIEPRVYGKAGRPCPRCDSPIQARGQGDDNRLTYWCPGCQR